MAMMTQWHRVDELIDLKGELEGPKTTVNQKFTLFVAEVGHQAAVMHT
jgi:hypothetical protein